MNVERHKQQQQQQQQPQSHQHSHQSQQQQQQQQQSQQQQQQQHHVHCSYDKEIICDDYDTHPQSQLQQQQQQPLQQQQQHENAHAHCHAHIGFSSEQLLVHSSSGTPHRHPQSRKHSHSPHPSRHTSPHNSHHSHSQHSSPHQSHQHVAAFSRNHVARHSTSNAQSSSSHAHSAQHHHHHRRRRRHHNNHNHLHNGGGAGGGGGGSGGGSGNSSTHGSHGHSQSQEPSSRQHTATCSRRHRSTTDVSSTSLNTCQDPSCAVADREVQEILVHKRCCSSSRTELAQYFAEDLYGSSRRPSSCCTSSDYCYQTDSTSLYGSRSSLSRNNSIKSASAALRKRRPTQRRPSYTSMSLRGLNAGRAGSQQGSLTSIYDGDDKKTGNGGGSSSKLIVSPSKVTIERQTSKDALSNELPEYACSPSPIRWSFLADGKSPTEFDNGIPARDDSLDSKEVDAAWQTPSDEVCVEQKYERIYTQKRQQRCSRDAHDSWKPAYDERPSTSAAAARKCRDSPFSCDFEESTTVLFHQEAEAYNNCCSNYIQCNTYLDQDLQITSEDIHQYLSKGQEQSGAVLNNSKNYPFQPSNALEFQYKNNFAVASSSNNNPEVTTSSECGDSRRSTYDSRYRRNSSKETNLNQNMSSVLDSTGAVCTGGVTSSCAPLSPTNINLSSSSNNINIVFNSSLERNANEVKFINTARDTNVVSTEAHHTGYLPYTYPTYDYANMSANSIFDKPLGIDELPKEFANANDPAATLRSSTTTASDGQHSSSLQSPVQTGVSFESFDAPSDHNLLSQRGSCQYSSTPRSPLSPASPASSCMSASINPAAASYVHTHHQSHFGYQEHQQSHQPHQSPPSQHRSHCHQHQHQHFGADSFKFSNAFKKVRKRARKYTEFLRKK